MEIPHLNGGDPAHLEWIQLSCNVGFLGGQYRNADLGSDGENVPIAQAAANAAQTILNGVQNGFGLQEQFHFNQYDPEHAEWATATLSIHALGQPPERGGDSQEQWALRYCEERITQLQAIAEDRRQQHVNPEWNGFGAENIIDLTGSDQGDEESPQQHASEDREYIWARQRHIGRSSKVRAVPAPGPSRSDTGIAYSATKKQFT
jgi:hypothetical protein